MLLQADDLNGGFAEPVLDAQRAFRTIMDAMARPATVLRMEAACTPPSPLHGAAAAVAATLMDADTPYWLDEALDSEGPRAWLAFHTGARLAAEMEHAAFALIGAPDAMPPLARFAQGTQDYPDTSATLILQVGALEGGPPLVFEGPGIKGRASIAPLGLPEDFSLQWAANRQIFPRGVDLILTAKDALACLPRSARLIGGEA